MTSTASLVTVLVSWAGALVVIAAGVRLYRPRA